MTTLEQKITVRYCEIIFSEYFAEDITFEGDINSSKEVETFIGRYLQSAIEIDRFYNTPPSLEEEIEVKQIKIRYYG